MKRLPKYKKGGNTKTDFISEKTAYLITKEGMKPSEAYAVANSMHEQKYKQIGGVQNQPTLTTSLPTDYYNTNPSLLNNYSLSPTTTYSPIETEEPQNQNYKQQFFDVYGGVDIPTAAYTLGEGIQTGDALQTVGSSLKLLTGLGRNAFAGAGNAKRNELFQNGGINLQGYDNYEDELKSRAPQKPVKRILYGVQTNEVKEGSLPPGKYTKVEYGDNTFDYLTDEGYESFKRMNNFRIYQEQQARPKTDIVASMQDGGTQQVDPNQVAQALQQGADPNEVLQMLISSGMSQEQATQLIQQIMQQLQGQQQPTEEAVMQDGGKKYKALTGEYTIEKDRIEDEDVVAELESREFLKTPTQEITQIDGETHENGGAKLTEEQIPDGSEVISDHLKLTKDQVKSFSEKYDLKLSTKDTYADILHKWNKKSGLDENVKEQEDLIKQIEKQVKLLEEKPEAETTINLNIDLLQKELAELEQEKAPLEEERKAVFNEVFKAQESQKPKEEKEDDKMQNGGMFNGDMVISYAKKHGISPDRAMELVNMYKNGGYKTYQGGGQKPIIQNSTTLTDFSNQPSVLERLPYTPRETNPNEIWRGENYLNVWKPLVEQSMTNPESAKKIDDWLMANKGTFSPNVQKQLENLTGQARIDRIKTLATDEKPGLFHNAVLQAIKETNPALPQEAIKEVEDNTFNKTDFNRGNSAQTRMGIMALPDQYAPLPDALQGNLKLEFRPNLIDRQNVTAEPIIAEIRRQEQSAMQAVQNLPDAQRGAAIAQLQANTQEQINKAMNQVQSQNLQADIQVSNANAGILNQAQDINNRYTLDFEGKILKADALTRNDIRNWMNHNQAVNLANSNAINKLNYYNQLSEYNQITPNGIEMTSSPTFNYGNMSDVQKARVREQVLADEEKKQLKAQKKTETKKNGGRIKRKL